MKVPFLLFISICLMAAVVNAQEFANVEYLCADWGPAMISWGKTNEPTQFSEKDEEIYFLKQVGRFTRKKRIVPNLLSGSKTEDIGHGTSIYLCKMKPDGTAKTEIKELWRNPNYPVDTQGQSTWMDVNRNAHKIALSITYAGNSITGLWTMNLDGSELKRIIIPQQNEKFLQAINHPSWMPDGKVIVFEEELRGTKPNRFDIALCDADGKNFRRLLEATKEEYMQPSVSPDGNQIAFTKYPDGYPGQRWIWLMNCDGTNTRPLGRKQSLSTWGNYPTWSPDGKKILLGESVIDIANGRKLIEHRPILQGNPHLGTTGWPQWGRSGIVGFCVGGILFTDPELREARWMGSSKLVECTGNKNIGWW